MSQLLTGDLGTVGAESDGVGQDATFTVDIPACDRQEPGDAAAAEKQAPEAAWVPLQSVRALVVEDDAGKRAVLATILTEAGARVTAVAGARRSVWP
jgi:hypothetical protein